MAPLGRKFTDLAQRSKGRQALRFQLELIPYFLDEVPPQVKQASFMWERGAKLQYTEPSPVNAKERTVYWGNTLLTQSATVYREHDVMVSKEYLFKVQSVAQGTEKRVTFAKAKVDLAQYCSCETTAAREIYIPLSACSPSGTLRISVQATWLKHSSPENDTMTEISGMSLGKSGASSLEEQDLSGFDSHQSRLHALRQKQAVDSPFGKARSWTPPPSPEAGPLKRGAASLNATAPSHPTLKPVRIGFQDVDLNEDQATPKLGFRPTRRPPLPPPSAAAAAGLAMDGSEATSTSEAYQSSQQLPRALPTNDYDKVLTESYATLISSDSEDEGGMVASAKRWWTDKKKETPRPSSSLRTREAAAAAGAAAAQSSISELQILNKEDANALRQLCKQTLRERDQERLLRQQAERRARHLQSDCEALAMSKSMLVERLRETEDRLVTLRQEETMNSLVQAKIKLAQADYANLELQGHLGTERERVRVLKTKLTDLEAAYHSTLNSLDRLQAAPEEAEVSLSQPSRHRSR